MLETHTRLASQLAARYSTLSQVEAVALGGSLASGTADATSDIDLYVYVQTDIPAAERLAIAREYAAGAKTNDYWGPGNEWIDPDTGIHVDVMFWTTTWIEDDLDRILQRHEAWVGYSTCIWHTVRRSRILFDRSGWLLTRHADAQQSYPEPMVTAVVRQNYPILRRNESAYYFQIKKAVARGDLVSINHRVAAFLASYFDILFAVNRLPHPGEKRLVAWATQQCPRLPAGMEDHIQALIGAIPQANQTVLEAVNAPGLRQQNSPAAINRAGVWRLAKN
jgi:predicted nucleotidyltransferase